MTTLRKQLLRLALGMAALLAVWSCNAPFIPVPPPAQGGFMSALVSDGAGGQKTVWVAIGPAGSVDASVRVLVFNHATGSGVITQAGADGAYRSPTFDGTMGDHIDVSAEDANGDRSLAICLLLQDAVTAPLCSQ